MKKLVKKKIKEGIDSLKEVGGLNDPNLKKIIDRLEKVVRKKKKSKK